MTEAAAQQEKRAAALAYNYDEDGKWVDYWSNILIPDNIASKEELRRHFQLKYYQRYIDPSLQVDPLPSTHKKAPSSSADQQHPVNRGARTQNVGTRSRAPPNPVPSAGGPFRMDRQSIQFLANAWVIIMAALTMLPFVPRGLGDRTYRFTLLGTAVACGHSLHGQYGRPRTWSWQGLQTWLQSVVMGADFLLLLFCIVFASSFIPIKYAVIPVACRALEQIAPYLKNNLHNTQLYRKFLAKPCMWLESNTTTLRRFSANSEVGLGFLLIVMIATPQRNLVQVMLYWQLLKLKYHSPVSAGYHQELWAKINSSVTPRIQHFAPFLLGPVGYAKRWFLNMG